MDKFQRGKQVLHRVRLAAVMLAAILVAARPNPSYAVGVAIAEVRVDGQTIPRPTRTGGERPAAIQIPSSASRIRFLCTAGPEASPAADDALEAMSLVASLASEQLTANAAAMARPPAAAAARAILGFILWVLLFVDRHDDMRRTPN